MNAGASSARSSVCTYQRGENSTMEVGQGNLRLSFSVEEGKLTHYKNTRNLVCNVLESYMFY